VTTTVYRYLRNVNTRYGAFRIGERDHALSDGEDLSYIQVSNSMITQDLVFGSAESAAIPFTGVTMPAPDPLGIFNNQLESVSFSIKCGAFTDDPSWSGYGGVPGVSDFPFYLELWDVNDRYISTVAFIPPSSAFTTGRVYSVSLTNGSAVNSDFDGVPANPVTAWRGVQVTFWWPYLTSTFQPAWDLTQDINVYIGPNRMYEGVATTNQMRITRFQMTWVFGSSAAPPPLRQREWRH
jgi:hypothetical protein